MFFVLASFASFDRQYTHAFHTFILHFFLVLLLFLLLLLLLLLLLWFTVVYHICFAVKVCVAA